MDSFRAIINAFGGPEKFGTAIGVIESHARTMKARDSIPSARWPKVVSEATERGIAGVTLELLATLAAAKAERRSDVAPAEPARQAS